MAILYVVHHPHPLLRQKALPVEAIDGEIRTLAQNMLETMYAEGGIGLAANQVGVSRRVVVIDLAEDRSRSMCLINPEIIFREGETAIQEGCLSVPGVFEPVPRSQKIRLQAMNLEGGVVDRHCDGLLAICIQHEIDHLNGKLLIDYLSPLKRQRFEKKRNKQRKKISVQQSAL